SNSQYIAWQNCYESDNADNPSSLIKTQFGYIISRTVYDNQLQIPGYHGAYDANLMGLDTVGNFLWQRCYGGSQNDAFSLVIQNIDNTYYAVGSTSSDDGDLNTPIQGPTDLWLVKLDSNFNIIWQRTFGSPWNEQLRDAILTSDKGLLVLSRVSFAGYNVSVVYGTNDLWICKFSPDGELEWEKTIGNYYDDNALSLRKTLRKDLDTYYIIGSSEHGGGMVECRKSEDYDEDVIIYEIDRAGNLLRQFCYGGSQNDLGRDILPLKDGFVFTADTRSNDMDVSGNHGGSGDIWIVRCDTSGAILWQKCYGGSDLEWPVYIDTAQNGTYVVVGCSYSTDGDVEGHHQPSWNNDIWVLSIDSMGNLLSSKCFGSTGNEAPARKNAIVRSSNQRYTLSVKAKNNNGDITCLSHSGNDDIWTFNVLICDFFMLMPPYRPTGPIHACSASGKASRYTVPAIANQSHQWRLEPAEAGSLFTSGDTVSVYWEQGYEGTAAIMARSINVCGASAWSEPFYTEVENCTGITPYVAANIEVYPNPAQDHFTVTLQEGSSAAAEFTLYTLSGIPIRRTILESPHTRIDCKGLPSGLYFWCVTTKQGQIQGKIIVQSKMGN
ncbi:MAG: T9SS type A sorting domain-containing protein, partial [Bacteroidales bacterium]|nr:T9SS type A sorting domain-containing protein [Bacteroidales bacterium]